eukprot:TRINITY_DN6382_c0_g2_i2.p1 TRINITY_DN6382_c0_g2~~TRINITY_DN6382_c0_g2_i2.p1  ORF type:complete len:661 (-),score=124.00 TRINITY_DN6382_c0_g2_i2:565-2463(-)
MSASSILPISDKTLIYGSGDGGKVVHCNEEASKIMEKAGKFLNLEKHEIGTTKIQIIGPGDIELHKGLDDELYVVDLGRLMPPEYPLSKKFIGNPYFYNLLRPICVQKWDKPLCSDTFSNWDSEEKRAAHQLELIHLSSQIPIFIKQFIGELLKHYSNYQDLFDPSKLEDYWIQEDNFIKALHSAGLNCRHIGLVRSEILRTEPSSIPLVNLAALCLTECVVRTIKNELRSEFREVMKKEEILTETSYLKTVHNYFSNKISWVDHKNELICPINQHIDTTSFTISCKIQSEKNVPKIENIEGLEHYCISKLPFITDAPDSIFYMEICFKAGTSAMIGLVEKDNDTYKIVHEYWSSGRIRHNNSPTAPSVRWKNGDIIGLLGHSSNSGLCLELIINSVLHPAQSFVISASKLHTIILFDQTTVIKYNFGDTDFYFNLKSYCMKLNLHFPWSSDKSSKIFWTDTIKKSIISRFPKCLTKTEKSTDVDLRLLINRRLYFHYLPKYCSIEFSKNWSNISNGFADLQLEDIITLKSKTTNMGIISYAEAIHTLISFQNNPRLADIIQVIKAEQQFSHILSQSTLKHPRDDYYWSSICFALFKSTGKEEFLTKAHKIIYDVSLETDSIFYWYLLKITL